MWNTHRYSPAGFAAAVEVVGGVVVEVEADGRLLPPTTLGAVGKVPMPFLFSVLRREMSAEMEVEYGSPFLHMTLEAEEGGEDFDLAIQ